MPPCLFLLLPVAQLPALDRRIRCGAVPHAGIRDNSGRLYARFFTRASPGNRYLPVQSSDITLMPVLLVSVKGVLCRVSGTVPVVLKALPGPRTIWYPSPGHATVVSRRRSRGRTADRLTGHPASGRICAHACRPAGGYRCPPPGAGARIPAA